MRQSLFTAAALGLASTVAAEYSVRTVYQFEANDTWLENVRVRSNGIVLATEIGPPASLLAFDPFATDADSVLIWNYTFDAVLGLSGLTEGAPDVFYVTGANTTSANIRDPPANATKLWRVDFNTDEPTIDLIASPVSPLTDFNGLTTYNESIILASASFESSIYAVNVDTGDYWQAFIDDEMSDINGIKYADGYVYWTEGDPFVRAPIYSNFTLGAAEIIADGYSIDDFALMPAGFRLNSTVGNDTLYAYLCEGSSNVILQVAFDAVTGGNNVTEIVAGASDSIEVAEPTGAYFGRAAGQTDKIYVVTGGGSGVAVDVDGVETAVGAQLLEITLPVGKTMVRRNM